MTLRRYRCIRCEAVVVVGPLGLLHGWLYSAPAIAWALALFGHAKLSASKVRSQTSPWSAVGATAAAGWAQLRRWAHAVRLGRLFGCVRRSPADWTVRQVAERAATTLAAFAPPADRALPLEHQAWHGALNLGRAIAM